MAESDADVAAVMYAGARNGVLSDDDFAVFDGYAADDLAAGLRLQLLALQHWRDDGAELGGWKIGLTSLGGRDSMGAGFRPFGYVLADRVLGGGARLPMTAIGTPRLEPEIGLRLGADLGGPDVSPEQARAAVASVHAAFEVLDRRVPTERRNPIVRLADGLGQWGVVFGPPRSPDLDLAGLPVTLSRDDEVIGRGSSGPDVVDDPFLSLSRVCAQLDRFGLGLQAGQHVITGSLLEPVTVEGPGRWAADLGALGSVAITFYQSSSTS